MLKEFKVQNFKSLKDVKLRLRKFNLLVGRNATGKTSVIEAFKLLQKIRQRSDSSFFNPFYEWGGYQNVVWRGREELEICIGYKAQIDGYEVSYEIYVTGFGGSFEILRENRNIQGVVNETVEGNKLIIKHNPQFIEGVWSKVEKLSFIPFPLLANEIKKSLDKDAIIYQEYELEEKDRTGGWSAVYSEDNKIALLRLAVQVKEGKTPIIISPTVREKRKVRHPQGFREEFTINPLITLIGPLIGRTTPGMLALRQLNFREIRTPQPVKREIMLREDGSNLANVLHTIYTERGGVPHRIHRVLRSIFGDVRINPEITPDGRVFIRVHENDYELHPYAVSDGFWKILTILTAIELNPSIILIDELENSLHPEAIEYIVNELKNSESVVIATTHSPAVVDIVYPEDLILFEKDQEGETVIKRVKDAENMKKWLAEQGITLSEGWLYGEMFHADTY